jgi:hypothetical protein
LGSDSDWIEAGFIEDATTWIDRQLDTLGEKRTGPVEQPHRTGWATVLRVPTSTKDVYFKAVSPAYKFEIRLTAFLAQTWPTVSPRLLASDADRGWMMMLDGGSRLRELLKEKPDLGRWEAVLDRYAQLQRQSSDHGSQLLAMGIPDRRIQLLLERFEQFLVQPDKLIGDELSKEEIQQLISSRQKLEIYVRELDDLGIRPCLDHGDFHDGNIFVDQGAYIFFDWGDAGLTHPFFSLRTAFVSLENSLGFKEDDPIFSRLSDHYLRQWTDWGSMQALRRAYLISKPLASINAAVRWQEAIDDLEEDDRTPYRSVIPSLLCEVLIGLGSL